MWRAVAATAAVLVQLACASAPALPTTLPLGNEEFWQLSTALSEPGGEFLLSDNLVSNEILFAQLTQRLRPRAGVYIGVGPEQNFSYIARLQPGLAFIIDIRPENRHLHLMYKALFEISADRAEFVSRLFSRERLEGVSTASSVDDLFAALDVARPSMQVFEENARLVRTRLVETRQLPMSDEDLGTISAAFKAFYTDGPSIRYGRSLPPSHERPSYRVLMTATDLTGRPRSYLATEEAFAYVKELQLRNLIVPFVGDFAGPTAIRAVGDYVRSQRQVVSAFYGSNVEVYLTRDQRRAFCSSLETLPYDDGTWFITNRRLEPLASKLAGCASIGPSLHWP